MSDPVKVWSALVVCIIGYVIFCPQHAWGCPPSPGPCYYWTGTAWELIPGSTCTENSDCGTCGRCDGSPCTCTPDAEFCTRTCWTCNTGTMECFDDQDKCSSSCTDCEGGECDFRCDDDPNHPLCYEAEDQCVECIEDGDWETLANVTVNPNPEITAKIENALNQLPGVNVSLDSVHATFEARKKDCCHEGTLIDDGIIEAGGNAGLTIEIAHVKLWPQVPTLGPYTLNFLVGSIDVTFEGGLFLDLQTTLDVAVAKVFNACENLDCIKAELDVDLNLALTFGLNAIFCYDTWWSSPNCVGMDLTAELGAVRLKANIGYNTNGCNGWNGGNACLEGSIGCKLTAKVIFDNREYSATHDFGQIAGFSCGD